MALSKSLQGTAIESIERRARICDDRSQRVVRLPVAGKRTAKRAAALMMLRPPERTRAALQTAPSAGEAIQSF